MAADLVEKPSWGVKTPWDPCSPQEGVEGSAPLSGDLRVIVGPIPAQMDDFCDLNGTPDTPFSRIVYIIGYIITNFQDNVPLFSLFGPF